jgi:hypothetical protein
MKLNQYEDDKSLKAGMKWHQLNQKQQIIVSTMLRDQYIKFVLENNRKPGKNEKQFIAATVYLELQEKGILISDNEIVKYFNSKIPKYDKSIEKAGLQP